MNSFKDAKTIILSLVVFSLTFTCYLIASAQTNVLEVEGTIYRLNEAENVVIGYPNGEFEVEITNENKGLTKNTDMLDDGTYGEGFFDFSNPVAESGDVIKVVVTAPNGKTAENSDSYVSGTSMTIDVTFATQDEPLPTTLSGFTANYNVKEVTLKWRTESEVNNLGFDIYRSETPDGKFVKINHTYIKGAGTDSTPRDYNFVDESAVVGKTYYYYLESISFSGERERSHIIKVIVDAGGKVKVTNLQPKAFALLQNFPNPFNPETWIPFRLAEDADVTIRIFDIRGKEIRNVHLGQMSAGYYDSKGKAAFWDGRDSYGQEVSSGIYFYNITAGSFSATRKLTIIK